MLQGMLLLRFRVLFVAGMVIREKTIELHLEKQYILMVHFNSRTMKLLLQKSNRGTTLKEYYKTCKH
jgi:hypothetical protein